mgnify:CR=1 FL=1
MAPRTWRSPCAASTGALGAAGKPAPGRTSPYGGLHWLFSGRGPWLEGGLEQGKRAPLRGYAQSGKSEPRKWKTNNPGS